MIGGGGAVSRIRGGNLLPLLQPPIQSLRRRGWERIDSAIADEPQPNNKSVLANLHPQKCERQFCKICSSFAENRGTGPGYCFSQVVPFGHRVFFVAIRVPRGRHAKRHLRLPDRGGEGVRPQGQAHALRGGAAGGGERRISTFLTQEVTLNQRHLRTQLLLLLLLLFLYMLLLLLFLLLLLLSW